MSPISNEDARKILHLKNRGSAWRLLRELTTLNMLEKRGNVYRTSSYGRELLIAESYIFQGAMKGRWSLPDAEKETSEKIIRYLTEGTEFLHERGKIDSTEYQERLGFIEKLTSALSSPK